MNQDCSYNELYPLQVLDDSMEPEFPEKCIIVIEPSDVCATGAFVVAEANGERWFRQYLSEGEAGKKLVALKSGYPDISLKQGKYKIVGVVVQRNIGRKVKHYYPYVPNGVPPKPVDLS
jgi:SOS-response transcriptional repressor LexA